MYMSLILLLFKPLMRNTKKDSTVDLNFIRILDLVPLDA